MEERTRGLKYIEGFMEKKELSKWASYWTVIRGSQIFFYKDSNTLNQQNFVGSLDLGPRSSCSKGKKKKDKFEFELKTEYGKKHLLRVPSQIVCQQWIYAVGLSSQQKPPEPLPGKPEYKTEHSYTSPLSSPDSSYSESDSTPISSPVSPENSMFNFNGFHRHSAASVDQHIARNGHQRDSMPVSVPHQAQQPERYGPVPPGSVSPHPSNSSGQLMPEWYLGRISRDAAIKLLNKQTVGTFLVRDSETAKVPGSYTLSLRHRDKCRHHKIETLPKTRQLVIKGYEKHPFPSLEVLIKFFIQTQERDINLHPYIPTASGKPYEKPIGYEDMDDDEPTCISDEMSRMSLYNNIPQGNSTAPPPPLPSRKPGAEQPSGYKGNVSPSPQRKPPTSYENIPSKDKVNAAPGPPLPRRVNTGPHSYENVARKPPPAAGSYENVPERDRASPQSYQNVPPRSVGIPVPQSYQNVPPCPASRDSAPGGVHSYQNLPPKVAPRRVQTFHSENKPDVPQRARPQLVRRGQSANERDWARKGF